MLKPKTFCHNGGIFFLHVHKKSRPNFFCEHMLTIEKSCFVFNFRMLSESAYNIPNNCFLVKIAGSFPFGDVFHGTCIYICEALRDCFTFISMLKASINFRQVSVNLPRLVLGRNVNAAMS